jgi:hypothetical protein
VSTRVGNTETERQRDRETKRQRNRVSLRQAYIKIDELTHRVGGNGDGLVTIDGRREVIHQVGQGGADGGVVLGADDDEPK